MLHVRMDAETKRKATTPLAAMGLTPSEAVRLLLHRIAVNPSFSLEPEVRNAQTRAPMDEEDEMVQTRTARFARACKAEQVRKLRKQACLSAVWTRPEAQILPSRGSNMKSFE